MPPTDNGDVGDRAAAGKAVAVRPRPLREGEADGCGTPITGERKVFEVSEKESEAARIGEAEARARGDIAAAVEASRCEECR